MVIKSEDVIIGSNKMAVSADTLSMPVMEFGSLDFNVYVPEWVLQNEIRSLF